MVEQPAADDRADRQPERGRGRPGPDGLAQFVGVEDPRQDRHRQRQDGGRAEAQGQPDRDQRGRGAGPQAGQRAEAEQAHPGDQQPLVAMSVAEHPHREHGGGQGQQVAAADPLQLCVVGSQLAGERR
jgi:hypothetical protein